jgi:hypothetical protein
MLQITITEPPQSNGGCWRAGWPARGAPSSGYQLRKTRQGCTCVAELHAVTGIDRTGSASSARCCARQGPDGPAADTVAPSALPHQRGLHSRRRGRHAGHGHYQAGD